MGSCMVQSKKGESIAPRIVVDRPHQLINDQVNADRLDALTCPIEERVNYFKVKQEITLSREVLGLIGIYETHYFVIQYDGVIQLFNVESKKLYLSSHQKEVENCMLFSKHLSILYFESWNNIAGLYMPKFNRQLRKLYAHSIEELIPAFPLLLVMSAIKPAAIALNSLDPQTNMPTWDRLMWQNFISYSKDYWLICSQSQQEFCEISHDRQGDQFQSYSLRTFSSKTRLQLRSLKYSIQILAKALLSYKIHSAKYSPNGAHIICVYQPTSVNRASTFIQVFKSSPLNLMWSKYFPVSHYSFSDNNKFMITIYNKNEGSMFTLHDSVTGMIFFQFSDQVNVSHFTSLLNRYIITATEFQVCVYDLSKFQNLDMYLKR